jgi:hypothetical protein
MGNPQNTEEWNFETAKVKYANALDEQRPSVIYKPQLKIDGNQWCAYYGDMPEGVQGFGDSPELAMRDFDTQWIKSLPINPPPKESV